MEEKVIWEKMNDVFRDVFDDDGIEISRETTAADIDGWDSMSNIQLMVAIEKTIDVKFTTGEVANMKNVGEMVDVILKKLAG